MLNQVVLVGRLTKEPEVRQTNNEKNVSNITLAIPRNFKNSDGEYETDFVDITLWNGVASNTAEYCHKGDIIGVKGRLQADAFYNKEGEKDIRVNVVAEKVTFLSSRIQNEPETER